MFRERCRPKYTDEELKEVYATPWCMEPDWDDHVIRQEATLEIAHRLIDDRDHTGADLSCGDAYLTSKLDQISWILGDFAPGYQMEGPIESTIEEIPRVDVFVLTETLEHVDDPEYVLSRIRQKAKKLILSTPMLKFWDENPQHYWAWDKHAVRLLLQGAGFHNLDYVATPRLVRDKREIGYSFQIWGCS